MTNSERHITRMLRTQDLVNGEELLIVYFPKADEVTINGYSVARPRGLTAWEGQAVYHQAFGDKTYTVATESITKLYI